MTAAHLVGRDREIGALAGLIDRHLTAGRAVVVLGDPGIGKSALAFPLAEGRRAFESGRRPRPPGKTILVVRE
jgi:MoxR-like ATPase